MNAILSLDLYIVLHKRLLPQIIIGIDVFYHIDAPENISFRIWQDANVKIRKSQ